MPPVARRRPRALGRVDVSARRLLDLQFPEEPDRAVPEPIGKVAIPETLAVSGGQRNASANTREGV